MEDASNRSRWWWSKCTNQVGRNWSRWFWNCYCSLSNSTSVSSAKATGGAISFYGGKTIHTFTTSGDFTNPFWFTLFLLNMFVLLVVALRWILDNAGGGGGGGYGDWNSTCPTSPPVPALLVQEVHLVFEDLILLHLVLGGAGNVAPNGGGGMVLIVVHLVVLWWMEVVVQQMLDTPGGGPTGHLDHL